jgi:hypothetical protein
MSSNRPCAMSLRRLAPPCSTSSARTSVTSPRHYVVVGLRGSHPGNLLLVAAESERPTGRGQGTRKSRSRRRQTVDRSAATGFRQPRPASVRPGRRFGGHRDQVEQAVGLKVDETIANAAAVRPWIAVPAGGIRSLGYLECSARGILLIENSEPFEQVCAQDGITDRWLCVWNEGNPSKRLIRFLADLALPARRGVISMPMGSG